MKLRISNNMNLLIKGIISENISINRGPFHLSENKYFTTEFYFFLI